MYTFRQLNLFGAALFSLALGGVAQATVTTGPGGSGVTAGNSSIIYEYDYSESWTIGAGGANAARQGYAAQGFPLPAGVAVLENSHGNPSVSWSTTLGSIATDGSFSNGGLGYPGSSGSGSATGFTQTGISGEGNFTIPYGLSDKFVVQFDGQLGNDRNDIFINDNGFAGGTGSVTGITDNVGLAVFFRSDDVAGPSIGVYNGIAELDTGLTTGLDNSDIGDWNNFAAEFDLEAGMLNFWVNETFRGSYDFATAFPLLNPSNAFIGIGASGVGSRLWTDNFQVGSVAPVPEPASVALWLVLGGVVAFAARRRKRRLAGR